MNQVPLALSRIHYPIATLGPGQRIGIWFQGCSIRCPGCISLDTWAPHKHQTTVGSVLKAVSPWLNEASGVTVSGGEPFDQPDALRSLLTTMRQQFAGDTLVYTGYALEALDLRSFDGLIDALICDPFQLDQPQTLALRGSDNQRLVCLTTRGASLFGVLDRPLAPGQRTLEVMFEGPNDEIFLAGIPSRGDLQRLAALLASQGHRTHTTEDVRDSN